MHARTGDLLMPPIGRRRVDGAGVGLVETWIDQLAACP
jgi:hypothetical protein